MTMPSLQIGSCNLGGRPCLAAAIGENVPLLELDKALSQGVDFLELRVDQFCSARLDYIVGQARRLEDRPLLATIRHADEGGGWKESEQERLVTYGSLLPFAGAVDVELCSGAIAGEVITAAKEADCLSIGSFHDFKETPEDDRLDAVVARGDALSADIVKIAATCNSREDVQRLAAFLLRHRTRPMIVIGMGSWGLPTRLLFPALGSLVTYTFLGKPSAPGQLNWEAMTSYLNVLYDNTEPPAG